MRTLLLLRGSPGCGKTTWIRWHDLTQYTLSADDIRCLCASPVLTVGGTEEVSVANDKMVWEVLFKLLEHRMKNGEFTVIDATNSRTSELNKYKKLCEDYKYRIYCVDFTSLPIEEAKLRNKMRPQAEWVPDEAIDKMYARFATQKIPSGITVIQPEELDRVWLKKINLDKYKKVHHIGDVHGCYTALKQYLDSDGGIKDDEFYIFCGDYIDRGIENGEVIRFLLDIYDRDNVMLLEGNHERWLWAYGSDGVARSKDFECRTKTQLDESGVTKRDVRKLYRRFGQCAYYQYAGNTYLVTHGGLSTVPENLTTVATAQMIKGVGSYNDMEAVNETFARTTDENTFQIHGHRNLKRVPIRFGERSFNLEGGVEFGGDLRVLQLTPDGGQHEVYIKNTVFAPPEEIPEDQKEDMRNVGDMILTLRESKFIGEKQFGNISSFNFTKNAFKQRAWNNKTTKARGLFINIPRQRIVARSYDKFFNINEREETEFDGLERRLKFPVRAYVKENGFLGIVSYNEENDSLFISTKSNPESEYAQWFREMFERKVPEQSRKKIKNICQNNNVTFVFECVDMEHDPHIIEYPESKLFLLDIVYNDIEFKKMPYDEVSNIADSLGIQCKEMAVVIDDWQTFYDWYYEVLDPDYKYHGRRIEGFVIEDSSGFMLKLKLAYYNLWKFLRGVAHEAIHSGYINGRRTGSLTTALQNQFYGFCRKLHDREDVEELPKDICHLRNMFYETEEGRPFAMEEKSI